METNVSRRGFVLGGAAAVAASSFCRVALAAPASPLKLGIASYTFRKFNSDQLIDFMHQIKTPYVNLKADFHLPMTPIADVPKLAAKYRAAGLIITGGGTIYFKDADNEKIRPVFEYLKAAGIKMFIGSPTHEALPLVEKFLVEYDVRMAIHNHGPEDKEWPSPKSIHDVIDGMDHRIGYCVDLGHTMRSGQDPVEALQMAGSRLYDIHMKDLADKNKRESQVAVGEGLMPVKEIFKALIAMKYKGCVDLEYEIMENDPMPGVLKSFASMRNTLKELGYSA